MWPNRMYQVHKSKNPRYTKSLHQNVHPSKFAVPQTACRTCFYSLETQLFLQQSDSWELPEHFMSCHAKRENSVTYTVGLDSTSSLICSTKRYQKYCRHHPDIAGNRYSPKLPERWLIYCSSLLHGNPAALKFLIKKCVHRVALKPPKNL